MERCDVPRDIRRDGSDEFSQAADLIVRVVESWNQQRDDLQPEADLVNALDGVENWLKASTELAVVRVVEALEVDFVQVNVRAQEVEHLRGGVPIRDETGHQPGSARFLEYGDSPLAGDQRLVVGANHDLCALRQSLFN